MRVNQRWKQIPGLAMSALIQGHHLAALPVTDLMETGYRNCKHQLQTWGQKEESMQTLLAFIVLYCGKEEARLSQHEYIHTHNRPELLGPAR